VHPIALGSRGSGLRLEVEPGPMPRFDVLAGPGASGWDRVAIELGAAGHRVLRMNRGVDLVALAREHAILDAALLAHAREGPVQADARRLGWRSAFDPAAGRDGVLAAFPAVSIVIVAFGGKDLLCQCLAALTRNTAWPRLEIIVVDNGTRDGTSELLSEAAATDRRLIVIENRDNLGFARGCNLGIRRASGEYVVLLNDDTVVAPGWLPRLIAALERDPGLGLVCPVTNHIGNAAKIPVEYRTLEAMERLATDRAFEYAGQVLGLSTVALFCAAMRRQLLEAIGLLDERFEMGMFEDDDLSLSLRERGLRLGVALDAFVHHVGQASFDRLSTAEYLEVWAANRRRFEAKWRVRWVPPQT
jgi:GT2 family glycosyltransferase